MPTTAPVSTAIIILTAIISFRGFSSRSLLELLIFEPAKILRGKQHYRLASCALIHGDMMHLIFNMFSFYSFGSLIEQRFGIHILLALYIFSILGGSLLSLFFHKNEDYRALGASGGVCGVIFASIFLTPGIRITIFPLPFAMPAWLFAILFVVISYLGMKNQQSKIGHDAHLGGALSGLLLTAILYPQLILQSLLLFIILIAISTIVLMVTVKPKFFLKIGGKGNSKRTQNWQFVEKTHVDDDKRLDYLLQKISKEGLKGLTEDEKKQLDELSRKRNYQ